MQHQRLRKAGSCRDHQTASCAKSTAIPQPVPELRQLQHAFGNRAVGQLIQAKLRISQPGEPYDPESDRVAEQKRVGEPAAINKAVLAPSPQRHERGLGPFKLFSGKSDCSPTWFGDTTPEVDATGGSFTGKLKVTYNDAELKDPCVRECVEEHEAVHVRDLTPIVKKIHDCDVAAGNDWDKKGKCNEMATRELVAARAPSECNAYRASFTCLTLKVLDPSNKCSKPPHRTQVQKHRGYHGCELEKQCREAGTPQLGIPNA